MYQSKRLLLTLGSMWLSCASHMASADGHLPFDFTPEEERNLASCESLKKARPFACIELFTQVGREALRQKNFDRALTAFADAKSTAKQLIDKNSNNPVIAYEIARSHANISDTLWEAGRLQPSLEHIRLALEATNSLLRENPRDETFLEASGVLLNDHGRLLIELGENLEGLDSLQHSASIFVALATQNHRSKRKAHFYSSAAKSEYDIGSAFEKLSKPMNALCAYKTAQTYIERARTLDSNSPTHTRREHVIARTIAKLDTGLDKSNAEQCSSLQQKQESDGGEKPPTEENTDNSEKHNLDQLS